MGNDWNEKRIFLHVFAVFLSVIGEVTQNWRTADVFACQEVLVVHQCDWIHYSFVRKGDPSWVEVQEKNALITANQEEMWWAM